MTRKEAINILTCGIAEVEWAYPMEYATALDMAIDALDQEPKRGKWIDVSGSWAVKNACDQCGEIVFQPNYNYCPNCGSYNGG